MLKDKNNSNSSFTEINEKSLVFNFVSNQLELDNFKISEEENTKPWGGFFVIDESQWHEFISKFFSNLDLSKIKINTKIAPKILLVAPSEIPFCQNKNQKTEIWKSVTYNNFPKMELVVCYEKLQSYIKFGVQNEDRYNTFPVGINDWIFIAEIWQCID